VLQLSQIAELLHNIVSPHSNFHELEIVSKSVSKNMTTQTQNPIFDGAASPRHQKSGSVFLSP